jgi:hypothetical protein
LQSVQLDFIVSCKTVGSNKNIKENKEAPDKSWSVTRYIQVKHLHNIHDGADKKDKNYQI